MIFTKNDRDSHTLYTETIQNKQPLVLYFYTDWCGPCKQIAPIIEDLSTSYISIPIMKIDVDESTSLAAEHQVTSIPTLIFFKDGEYYKRINGTSSKLEISVLMSELL